MGKQWKLYHFILEGSKITADGDCSHEIKRRLLLGRKAITNLYSALKSRKIIFLTKVHIVKAMVFPVVIHMSWTIKNADWQRINAFDCGAGEDSWESLGQHGDQTSQSQRKSALNIHWKDWCWSWNSNMLATHLMRRVDSLEKTRWCCEGLGAGREGDDRGWDGWMASPIR